MSRPSPSAAGWRISVLGGVRITDPGGSEVDPGPAKCQELLGALVFSPDRAVSVDTLVDLLWGEEPPRTAAKTLQTYVARLRKAVGHERVARVGGAYRLDVADEEIDVRRFRAALADGDVARALDEWNGAPLAGVDAPGLQPMIDGLVEEWLAAVESHLERNVGSDPQSAIGRLTELTARYPFREGLWALLMTALYSAGRQAEALAAYRRARHHLVEELGVEPGPRLQSLEASILAHDDELAPHSDTVAPPAAIPTGTVTFAFSDLQGTNQLWTEHRPLANAAIARYEAILRTVGEAHGGYEIVAGGGTVGVAFHRAGDAARWSVALHHAMTEAHWPPGTALRVCVGIHTGDAEERSGSYYGPAVNVAARLASIGHGGQTLMSAVTSALLEGGDVRDVGLVRLDGIATAQRVYQHGPGDHPPLRTGTQRRGNLPRPPGRLIGRTDLVRAVSEAVTVRPVVTLVGPGGIGKTRLALEVARQVGAERNAGAWLVELGDVTASHEVARAVADLLDATDLPGRPLTESVVATLAGSDLVLVLDNCEHVVDGAAELVDAIATGCPDVRVVATSREGLGIESEQLVAVGPLDVAGPAVDLFAERAMALDRSFDIEVWRAPVEDICRRLDGVPLAIELAAARIRSLSPADVVERLDDSFRLLGGGRRRSVERHRTLHATIQWSYELLSPPEQMLLRRLSVFAGSFDLASAEHVAPDAELGADDIGRLLGDLVERSMVSAESGAYGRRFRLLEMIRQFGIDALAARSDTEPVAERHARFVAGEVAEISRLLAGREELAGAGRLAELWPNVRAAFDWAESHQDLDLATALVGPLAPQSFVRRGMGELSDMAERLVALAEPHADETVARALLWCSLHHVMTHDREGYAAIDERYGRPDHVLAELARVSVADESERALQITPLAIDELRRHGEDQLARLFEVFIGGALLGQGRIDEAEVHMQGLTDRLRAAGPPSFLNWTLFMLGTIADFRGDVALAQAHYDELLALPVPPHTNAPNDVLAARASFRRGEHAAAFEHLRTFVDEELRAGNRSGAGIASLEFVNMCVATGQLAPAARILGYLDQSGMLDVEERGFRLFVEESARIVDADPEAAAVRAEMVSHEVGDEWALTTIRDLLDELLDSHSTAAPPVVDHHMGP